MNEHMHNHHQHDSGQTVDPVCGMQVGEDSRHALTHEGKTYRFCSVHCLERFQNDPDSFLNKKGAA